MNIINPFISGPSVSGDHFVNRHKERESIAKSFRSLNNVILISPRRWGKSSLIDAVQDDMKDEKEYVFINIDAYFSLSEQEFFRKFAHKTLLALRGKFRASIDPLISLFKGTSLGLSFGPSDDGGFDVSLNIKEGYLSEIMIDDILNLPERIAKEKKVKVIVCIDEFQQTAKWSKDYDMIGKLRAAWQKHKNVSYCLYGSHLSMMNYLFNDQASALYRFGKVIPLKKIEHPVLKGFIISRMKVAGKQISEDNANKIIALAEGNSYYVQFISKEAYELSEGDIVTSETIDKALNTVIDSNDAHFRTIASSLTTNQKRFLRFFSKYDGEGIYTKEFIKESHLEYSANVAKVVKSLLERNFLFDNGKELEYEDPIFNRWVEINFN